MPILYLDCFSGISGDMMVGALTDLGVKPSAFEWELSKLELEDHHLHFEKQHRQGIAGIHFGVHAGAVHVDDERDHHHGEDDGHSTEHHHSHSHHHPHPDPDPSPERNSPKRDYSQILALLDNSDLSDFVKKHSAGIFRRIAEAEAKIHGIRVESVLFHEVGALDSVVDVVLTCVGLEALKVDEIHFSSLIDGQGTIRCSHGNYPLPAPATLEILKGLPIRQIPIPFELITPTGAAIVAEFQKSVGLMPPLRPEKIGYGVGLRDHSERPNVLRAVLGEKIAEPRQETIIEMQANIDDQSAELLAAGQERLLAAGALEVFLTPVQMKKGRPGTLLTLLCHPADQEKLRELLFRETSTFGIRFRPVDRLILEREIKEVGTRFGAVKVKIGRLHGEIVQVSPEFEDCRAVAAKSGVPLKRIYELAIDGFRAGIS